MIEFHKNDLIYSHKSCLTLKKIKLYYLFSLILKYLLFPSLYNLPNYQLTWRTQTYNEFQYCNLAHFLKAQPTVLKQSELHIEDFDQ